MLPQGLARELSLASFGMPVRLMMLDLLEWIFGVDLPENGSYDLVAGLSVDHSLPVAGWVGGVPLPESRGRLFDGRLAVCCANFVQRAEDSEEVLLRVLVGIPHAADDFGEVSFRNGVELKRHF